MSISGDELNQVVTERFRARANDLDFEHVASFCHVKTSAVAGWVKERKPLGGLVTIKLWFYLAQAGIESPELAKVRKEYPFGEYIGRLLAFDVLSMDDACAMANVKTDAILRAVRGEGRLTRCKMSFEDLEKAHDELLNMAIDEFGKLRGDSVSKEVTPEQSATSVLSEMADELIRRIETLEARLSDKSAMMTSQHPSSEGSGRLSLIQTIAEKLQAAHVVANLATSQLSAEERELLRQLMGEKSMFAFSTTLNRLCTERAFNHQGA